MTRATESTTGFFAAIQKQQRKIHDEIIQQNQMIEREISVYLQQSDSSEAVREALTVVAVCDCLGSLTASPPAPLGITEDEKAQVERDIDQHRVITAIKSVVLAAEQKLERTSTKAAAVQNKDSDNDGFGACYPSAV